MGGRVVHSSSSRGLQQFVQSMGFVDLGFIGAKYTWCNKRPGMATIRERLDCRISNVPWRLAFPNAAVHHYAITNSNHLPLLLNFFGFEQSAPKAFKFEGFWTCDPSCYGVVAAAWQSSGHDIPGRSLFQKIRATRFALRKWNKIDEQLRREEILWRQKSRVTWLTSSELNTSVGIRF